MYLPAWQQIDDEQARALAAEVGAAELISVDAHGYPVATRLPLVWRGDTVIFHMARANKHWRSIGDDAAGLAVITGPEAYVTPAWYAEKQLSGETVPTWNYSAVQLRGRLRVVQNLEWMRAAVSDLSDVREASRAEPWAVADAPQSYVDDLLRQIVGVEMRVESVQGKAKLSQNKSRDDQARIAAGLAEQGWREQAVAEQMRAGLA